MKTLLKMVAAGLLMVVAASSTLRAHELPHRVTPQHFEGTNVLQMHFAAQKIPVKITEHKTSDGGKWVIAAANPYSGVIATDCYIYRAQPGRESFGLVALYLAKKAHKDECQIEVVEGGVWLRILGERFAYFRQ